MLVESQPGSCENPSEFRARYSGAWAEFGLTPADIQQAAQGESTFTELGSGADRFLRQFEFEESTWDRVKENPRPFTTRGLKTRRLP